MSHPTPSIDEIFFAAMEQPSPEARAAYLDEVCGSDLDLRRRVERLLDAQPKVGGFLDSPAAGPTMNFPPPQVTEGLGSIIGPFKLLEQIGEGGMGIVYMAEQTQPVRRKVALKIIKPGMDTKQVIARFEAERQALAMMDHPNIAKVLDAGATESGRPYFVMELVRGVPITEYCDRHRLTISERLDLFKQVCQAVQHAHQKGIIHRDIKPTNVLVTSLDGVPLPRIIDFGIAKATGQSLTDKTLFTGFAQLIGTPLYMSPEQAELSAVDIDTRSDIYSLGVLLYELLTGTTPFDQDTFRTAALDEVRRIIREDEPPKPSTRLSALGATLTTVSANRQTDSHKLNGSLRGELDWIVMKALEKDRTRRYETPSGLARDVERYLAGDPVEAGPPSGWYRLRKFARRNRVVLTATVLVALALIAGTTVSIWQAILARRAQADALAQRDRADSNARQARKAVDSMYTRVAEEWLVDQPGLRPLQREFLQEAVAFYQEFARVQGGDPEARIEQATALRRVGDIQDALNKHEQTEPIYLQVIDLLNGLATGSLDNPRQREELAVVQLRLATWYRIEGRIAEVRRHFTQALEIYQALAIQYPGRIEYQGAQAVCLRGLGGTCYHTGKLDEAECLTIRARNIYESLASRPDGRAQSTEGLRAVNHNLGNVYNARGRFSEAESCWRRAVEISAQILGISPSSPDFNHNYASELCGLAEAMMFQGKWLEAEKLLRKAIRIQEPFAADLPERSEFREDLAHSLGLLGEVLHHLGQFTEQEVVLRRSIGMSRELVKETPKLIYRRVIIAAALMSLATLERDKENSDASQGLLAEASSHIRIGLEINPLDLDLTKLNKEFESLPRGKEEDAKRRPKP